MKQLKQIIQIENNVVKNPTELAKGKPVGYITSVASDLKLGATMKQIQVVEKVGLERGSDRLQVR